MTSYPTLGHPQVNHLGGDSVSLIYGTIFGDKLRSGYTGGLDSSLSDIPPHLFC
uniref:Uncharacterized protein n=1 Tax=Anguilla anguilla TaxID=7936 RepID=A0A0E9UXW1_ANGAN